MDIYKPVGKWENESNFTNHIGNDAANIYESSLHRKKSLH